MKDGVSLKQLNKQFSGKDVLITSTSTDGKNPRANEKKYGMCKTFHKTESGVDVELVDGSRYGLTPEILTDDFVEGKVSCLIALRRKVQLT